MYDNEALREQLISMREERGLKPAELARRAGLSRSYVWKFEESRIDRIAVEVVDGYARACGYHLCMLFAAEGERAVLLPRELVDALDEMRDRDLDLVSAFVRLLPKIGAEQRAVFEQFVALWDSAANER